MNNHHILVVGVMGLIAFDTALGFGQKHITIKCPPEMQVGARSTGEWTAGSGYVAAHQQDAIIEIKYGGKTWLLCNYKNDSIPGMVFDLKQESPASTANCQILSDRTGFRCSNLKLKPQWVVPPPGPPLFPPFRPGP